MASKRPPTGDFRKNIDEEFMGHALRLARATTGLASPNPQVGCVIVRDGVVVGEGSHVYEGRDHAEIVALRRAGSSGRPAAQTDPHQWHHHWVVRMHKVRQWYPSLQQHKV